MVKGIKMRVSGYMASYRVLGAITTQSTYSVPPRTALIGMLAAMIGVWKNPEEKRIFQRSEMYNTINSNVEVALKVKMSDIHKYVDYVNYRKKDKSIKPTLVEFITNPKYDIIYWSKNNEINNLVLSIKGKREFFKATLGNNEYPAVIESVREVEVSKLKKDRILTEYVTDSSMITRIVSGENYIVEKLPRKIEVDERGKVKLESREYIVPLNTKIEVNLRDKHSVYKVGDGYFVPL